MPELPDVEHFRRRFARHATGRRIRRVDADPSILRNAGFRQLRAALVGRRFGDPDRHGKWLLAWTDGPTLLLHFGMTGGVVWSGEEPERHRHDRLALTLDDGHEVRYRNMRKLGGVWLAHSPEEVAGVLGPLGPDALEVRRRQFLALLSGRRGGVKAALMDQALVAGIGNLVADEVLWHARLHPRRPVGYLADWERDRLYTEMRRVLRESVERYDYVSRKRSWLAHVRGRADARCPRCRTLLQRTVAAGRTTWFCPACQPG